MNLSAAVLSLSLLLLAGCASAPSAPENGEASQDKGLALKKDGATAIARGGRLNATPREPDAIIRFAGNDYALSREMDLLITRIVREAQGNDQLMIRLEGYMPEGGSSALNLSLAERPMQVVRAKLIELRVPARRIVLAPFGGEHRVPRDKRRGWVEIYLLPGQGR